MSTLQLPDVTLIAATSTEADETQAALLHCAGYANFGAVKMLILGSELPRSRHAGVEYVTIPSTEFLGYQGYQRFMIEELNAYVETGHCLVVQADGFICDPSRWRDQFLGYDYIGAPWPECIADYDGWVVRLDRNRVGNGGFSLRSKKLLEAASRVKFEDLQFPKKSEDILICHYLFDHMQAAGIRFAPLDVAAIFSIEMACVHDQSINTVFGFHGKQWLARPWEPQPQYNVNISYGS